MSVDRKVHRLTKILTRNAIKRGLLFDIVPLWPTHFFHQCCSAWIPLIKNNPQQIRSDHMNFSTNELFRPSIDMNFFFVYTS